MKNKSRKIKVVAASVAGLLHVNKKIACQDCFNYTIGKNLVAVVSDGAGSAKYGKIGAKNVCETLCDLLKNASFTKIESEVIRAVKVVREKLLLHRFNKTKNEEGLPSFAATIVGVVYNEGRGVFFHIGDGAGIALHDDNKYTISRPANGNFSCETFFYTMHNWQDSLRFTKIDKSDTIFLMTDGVTNFALSDDMYKIIKEEQKTAIMITHDIAEAISMSERVIILTKRPGRIKKEIKVTLTMPEDGRKPEKPSEARSAKEFAVYYQNIWKELMQYDD